MSELGRSTDMKMHMRDVMASLSLPEGHYVLFGSGVMQVAGLRYANDLDFLVSDQLFNFCTRAVGFKPDTGNYSVYDKAINKRIKTDLPPGHPRGQQWVTHSSLKYFLATGISDSIYPMSFETALEKSETVDGICRLPLAEIMRWKYALVDSPKSHQRDKHLKDVGLIATHLHDSSTRQPRS